MNKWQTEDVNTVSEMHSSLRVDETSSYIVIVDLVLDHFVSEFLKDFTHLLEYIYGSRVFVN